MSGTDERFERDTGMAYATRTCVRCGSTWNHASWICPKCGPDESVTPETILRIADEHPILSSVVKAWRMGAFSWEQAMMAATAYLADQNSRLMQDAVKLEMLRIPDPIEVNGEIRQYVGPCPVCNQPVKPELLRRNKP